MGRSRHSHSGKAATDLILEVFRLNGRLLASGDKLVASLGLTSARWQVLGAIAFSPTAEPVARLARNMGLHRQGVQRIVNELAKEGLVAFQANPHHRRANLVVLTPRGRELYDQADQLQIPWVNGLSVSIKADVITSAIRTLQLLRKRLERQRDAESVEND